MAQVIQIRTTVKAESLRPGDRLIDDTTGTGFITVRSVTHTAGNVAVTFEETNSGKISHYSPRSSLQRVLAHRTTQSLGIQADHPLTKLTAEVVQVDRVVDIPTGI